MRPKLRRLNSIVNNDRKPCTKNLRTLEPLRPVAAKSRCDAEHRIRSGWKSMLNERESRRKRSCGGRARFIAQVRGSVLATIGGRVWRLMREADKLPLDLDQQLRMNRRDVMLPDSDGEIWSQIVQAQDRDKTLFDGNKATTIKRLRAELQLGGAFKFFVDRVVTLWNNARWREMLRQWSETELGRSNFSVYMFEWMAGLRIDEVSVCDGRSISMMLTQRK